MYKGIDDLLLVISNHKESKVSDPKAFKKIKIALSSSIKLSKF